MNERDVRKSDVLSGLVLVGVGFLAAVTALGMPIPPDLDPLLGYLTYPGSMPLLLGFFLILGGLALVWHGFRIAGPPGSSELRRWVTAAFSQEGRRAALIFLLLVVYSMLLLGRVPFWLATFVYLVAVMALVGGVRLRTVAAVALAASASLHLLFEFVFNLPLP